MADAKHSAKFLWFIHFCSVRVTTDSYEINLKKGASLYFIFSKTPKDFVFTHDVNEMSQRLLAVSTSCNTIK